MGWNGSVILIENTTADAVKRLLPAGFRVTDRLADWGEVNSTALEANAALGEIPGWSVIWTPNSELALSPEFLEGVSGNGRAMCFAFSSVSTIYGFSLSQNGRHRRTLFRENYEPVTEDGEPLPEEAGLDWEDDEVSVFELARRPTGLDLKNWQIWDGVLFALVELG
jgi:hypothetical protein